MKKTVLKRIAILAAPIIWRKIRGKRARNHWHEKHRWHRKGRWHERSRHFGHKRRGIWL
jgi:hypothetical protein